MILIIDSRASKKAGNLFPTLACLFKSIDHIVDPDPWHWDIFQEAIDLKAVFEIEVLGLIGPRG